MKISVIGTGYVGLVAGTCLADMGNKVICVDIDEEKIASLNRGEITIFEPGLKDLLDINTSEKRLLFTTDIKDAVERTEVIYIAVGTPMGENHEADLTAVLKVAESIGKYANGDKVVVDKSTVPVGTAEKVKKTIMENLTGDYEIDVVSNPEFLREGAAVKDFSSPDRIVIGTDSARAEQIMSRIYRSHIRTDNPLIITSVKSAEMIKYASNAFLATKISFMNEIARLCDKVGADVKEVAAGMGLDKRIGSRFLQAGVGYGGSCFPKDVMALIQTGIEHDTPFRILPAVDKVNTEQRELMITKLKNVYSSLKGKKVCLWGLAFKPKTDDMREAPSVDIIKMLLEEGAEVNAFDPVAEREVLKDFPQVNFGQDIYSAAEGCDAVLLVTEWNEFRHPDFERIKDCMNKAVMVDGRNIYDRAELEAFGFIYAGFGR